MRFYLKGGDREATKVRIRGKPRAKAKQRFKRGGQKGFEEDPTSPVSSQKVQKIGSGRNRQKEFSKNVRIRTKQKVEFRIMSRHENSLAVDAVGVAR